MVPCASANIIKESETHITADYNRQKAPFCIDSRLCLPFFSFVRSLARSFVYSFVLFLLYFHFILFIRWRGLWWSYAAFNTHIHKEEAHIRCIYIFMWVSSNRLEILLFALRARVHSAHFQHPQYFRIIY